jgi:hypothetical protein
MNMQWWSCLVFISVEGNAILHVIVEELLKTLSRFQTNPSVIGKVCLAMGSIANAKCKVSPHEDHGTVEAVLESMMFHADDLTVQECGMWALSLITQDCK